VRRRRQAGRRAGKTARRTRSDEVWLDRGSPQRKRGRSAPAFGSLPGDADGVLVLVLVLSRPRPHPQSTPSSAIHPIIRNPPHHPQLPHHPQSLAVEPNCARSFTLGQLHFGVASLWGSFTLGQFHFGGASRPSASPAVSWLNGRHVRTGSAPVAMRRPTSQVRFAHCVEPRRPPTRSCTHHPSAVTRNISWL